MEIQTRQIGRFVVETNIPIETARGAGELRLLAREMNVGDSILVDNQKEKARLSAAMNNEGFGMRSCRVGQTQWRVWKGQPHKK